jgi:glycosyltransferase involved in cell wall biosynthesis
MREISVVIITLNEEKNLERAILSAKKIASDIVVVDSFSTDQTPQIAQQHGVVFTQRKWDGYGLQKNFAASLAANDWVFCLDADEEFSDELIQSLQSVSLDNPNVIYETERLNNFCGKWIKHGQWGRDKVHRFYNRQATQWDENPVHENIIFYPKTEVKSIDGKLYHYSYNSLKELEIRSEKYAQLAAQKLFAEKRKSNFFKININPAFKFFVNFFLRLGFLDGKEGFFIAKNAAYETRLKYKKLKLLQTKPPQNENRT